MFTTCKQKRCAFYLYNKIISEQNRLLKNDPELIHKISNLSIQLYDHYIKTDEFVPHRRKNRSTRTAKIKSNNKLIFVLTDICHVHNKMNHAHTRIV